MSDFTSNFWSLFVAAISILGIAFCVGLLWFSAKIKMHTAGDNTTGHVWDENLEELNNPLPRWWLWLFIITIVFAAIYWFSYPGMGSYKGSLGWTSQGQYEAEVAKANQDLQPLYAAFDAQPPEQLAGDLHCTPHRRTCVGEINEHRKGLAFVDALVVLDLSRVIAALFVLAMLALIGALTVFLREIFLAVNAPRSAIR